MQLSLLDDDPRARLAAHQRDMASLRERLPEHLYLGTVGLSASWLGTVFDAPKDKLELTKSGLREWARHPLMRAYWWPQHDPESPLDRDAQQLAHSLLPEHVVVLEAPSLFTTPRLPDHRQNAMFLHAKELAHSVVAPVRRVLGPRLFAVALRFPYDLTRYSLTPETFPGRLSHFLAELAVLEPSVHWAIELLPPAFVTLDYARMLAEHGASSVVASATQLPLLQQVPSGPKVLFRLIPDELTLATSALHGLPPLPTVVCLAEPGDGSAIGALASFAQTWREP